MTVAEVRVALVGYGYWGPNLARNFLSSPSTELVAVCDLSEQRRNAATRSCPGVVVTDSFQSLLGDSSIQAIAIATPTSSHYPLARAALLAGKHVFVEKPLADSVAHAEELVALAAVEGLTLHVDHTFLYTSAVEYLKESVDSGHLGDLLYFDSTRVNLGLYQPDVNVLWDLAVHDLSILQYVTGRRASSVSATGTRHPQASQVSAAFMTVTYEDLFVAHIDVSWMSPVKLRRTLLSGTDRMLVYDDLETTEKIKIFDSGADFPDTPEQVHDVLVSYRTGDMRSPRITDKEALETEVAHFSECVTSGISSRTNGRLGADLVAILEAACESLEAGGTPVTINSTQGVTP